MIEELIAPCGMNCNLCRAYQFRELDANALGFHRKYCPGCIPRGQNCVFMKSACDIIGEGKVRFCYECDRFPCKRLKSLDKRYRTKYHMSMIENLNFIQQKGMESFLASQQEMWACPTCKQARCCHEDLCLHCDIEILLKKKGSLQKTVGMSS